MIKIKKTSEVIEEGTVYTWYLWGIPIIRYTQMNLLFPDRLNLWYIAREDKYSKYSEEAEQYQKWQESHK